MQFQPVVNEKYTINTKVYQIAEHPNAPGIPYGQEGRQAIVYQLFAPGGEKYALKVFKARFRLPGLVSLAERMTKYVNVSGLTVCERAVLRARTDGELLKHYPDLTYAVLMPWIYGPTWMEVMLRKEEFTPEQSLKYARALADILASMEEQSLAHCDLSGPNLLLPGLFPSVKGTPVQLVDVEQMYGPDLIKPALLPGGSPGYAHMVAGEGLWSPEADRFAGAILLLEMLGWCDPKVREASWGESYFEPGEMHKNCKSYQTLMDSVMTRWGAGVAKLFERSWKSETLSDCPTFGEWLVTIPNSIPSISNINVELATAQEKPNQLPIDETDFDLDKLRELLIQAREKEYEGEIDEALNYYGLALSLSQKSNSSFSLEIEQTMAELEKLETDKPASKPKLYPQGTFNIINYISSPFILLGLTILMLLIFLGGFIFYQNKPKTLIPKEEKNSAPLVRADQQVILSPSSGNRPQTVDNSHINEIKVKPEPPKPPETAPKTEPVTKEKEEKEKDKEKKAKDVKEQEKKIEDKNKQTVKEKDAVLNPNPLPKKSDSPYYTVAKDGSGDFTTITEALRNTKKVSKIVLKPGIYEESLTINEPVEIVGENKNNTVIKATDNYGILVKADTNTQNITVRNLTVRNNSSLKGAIEVVRGQLAIENCILSTGSGSHCVKVNGSNLTVRNSSVSGGTMGFSLVNQSTGRIYDCNIFDNQYGVFVLESKAEIKSSKIYNNKIIGVHITVDSEGLLDNCDITSNEIGVLVESVDTLIKNCRINRNDYGIKAPMSYNNVKNNDMRFNLQEQWKYTDVNK